MNLKIIQLRKTALYLIIFYIFGYTHFFGGSFWLARFLFVTILSINLISLIFTWGMMHVTKKVIYNKNTSSASGNIKETIKVESKIIE